MKRGIGELLRAAVVGIFLSPVLILVRLFAPRSAGDLGVVIFALLVVVFFALLNLYVLVSIVHYHARRRKKEGFHLPFSSRGGDALDLFDRAERAGTVVVANPGDTLRVSGVVQRLSTKKAEPDGVLIEDWWFPDSSPAWRITEATDFVIVGEEQPPVVVRVLSAPILIAPPEVKRRDLGPAARALISHHRLSETEVSRVTLREGDTVEVVGLVDQIIADVGSFELDGRIRSIISPDELSSPYRRKPQGTGSAVRCTAKRPTLIRKTGA